MTWFVRVRVVPRHRLKAGPRPTRSRRSACGNRTPGRRTSASARPQPPNTCKQFTGGNKRGHSPRYHPYTRVYTSPTALWPRRPAAQGRHSARLRLPPSTRPHRRTLIERSADWGAPEHASQHRCSLSVCHGRLPSSTNIGLLTSFPTRLLVHTLSVGVMTVRALPVRQDKRRQPALR